MEIIDPGHVYDLSWLDGRVPRSHYLACDTHVSEVQEFPHNRLVFVKREGEKYPGNVGAHPGTTMQEVLRALIHRLQYVDAQIPDRANAETLYCLRNALWFLEWRAARRHGREADLQFDRIELQEVCPQCGHIGCLGACQ